MKLSDWPSIRLVIPLTAGIFISDTIKNTWAEVPVWYALVLIGIFTVIILIFSDRFPRLSGFCLSLAFVLAGAASYRIQMDRVRVEWPSHYRIYHGVLNSYPLERDRSYRLDVTLSDSVYIGKNIYLYLPKDSVVPTLEPGQKIVFDGKINKPSSEGAGFDYESYLLSHGISGTLRVQSKDWKELPAVEAAFKGIRPAVVALIAAPLYKLSKSAKIGWSTLLIPIAAALLIWLFHVNPVWVIVGTIVITLVVVDIVERRRK